MAISTKIIPITDSRIVEIEYAREIKICQKADANDYDPIYIEKRIYIKTQQNIQKYKDNLVDSFSLIGVFYKYPTLNCQLGSIANIQSIIPDCGSNILEVLTHLHKVTLKPSWLLDVHTSYVPTIHNTLGEDNIRVSHNYISTNNSAMSLLIFDSRSLSKYIK